MRIAWLVPARYAETLEDGTMHILHGGIDTLVVKEPISEIPLSVVLAMRIAGLAREWRDAHTLSVFLVESSLESTLLFERHLSIAEAPLIDGNRDIAILVPAVCQWSVQQPGQMTLSVLLDDREEARVGIRIVGDSVQAPPDQS